MAERVETVIVGGGQAGLSMSYFLTTQGRENIVLEQAAQAGEAWRNHRWDSFTLVTPNWLLKLPGAEYQGNDPDGYLPRAQIVAMLEQYAARYHLPVRYNTHVTSVEPNPGGDGYRVTTDQGTLDANRVVMATGLFQTPKVPRFAADLPAAISQLSSDQYRSPGLLPPGGILVVGSGQSGCQIAEELYQSGRKVTLSVGTAGRVERRYRGKDILWWWQGLGLFDQTPDKLPSPRARFFGNPHVTGKNGGHSLNLHQFARDGVRLVGHLRGFQDGRLKLETDLQESLAKVDRFCADNLKAIDEYILKLGLEDPKEDAPVLTDGYAVEPPTELDLEKAGISTVIWSTGYDFDFHLVKLPVLDEYGYPLQQRGVTAFPGLYFLGLPWLHARKSGLFYGVGEDAAHLAAQLA